MSLKQHLPKFGHGVLLNSVIICKTYFVIIHLSNKSAQRY